MALVTCPKCGKENVSDSALRCPGCSYPIAEHFNKIKAEEAHKAECREKYDNAIELMKKDTVPDIKSAVLIFKSIEEYEDSLTQAEVCQKRLLELKAQNKAKIANIGSKIKKVLIATALIVAIAIVVITTNKYIVEPSKNYKAAVSAAESGDYDTAFRLFNNYPDYKDTEARIVSYKTKQATELVKSGKYDGAKEIFDGIKMNDSLSAEVNQAAAELINMQNYDAAYFLYDILGDEKAVFDSKYTRADEFIKTEDYISAYNLLGTINDDKAEEKKQEIKEDFQNQTIRKAEIGSSIFYGTYEQDNNKENGKEDIEWTVLDKKDGKLLVISKYALDTHVYGGEWEIVLAHVDYTKATWEKSSVRRFLNKDFINNAFTKNEAKRIIKAKVKADQDPAGEADQGKDTMDHLFLLSVKEILKYFPNEKDRGTKATAFASPKTTYDIGFGFTSKGGACWTRTTKGGVSYTDCVECIDGTTIKSYNCDNKGNLIRPAMWVEIPS